MRSAAAGALLLISATAASAQPDLTGEIRRGADAVAMSSSEVPAVRAEASAGQPSRGFLLGAAFRAWSNAASVLAFDLVNPTAGPPHASQNGNLSEFLREECREEGVAFDNLQARSAALAMTPAQATAAAGGDPADAARWTERWAGPPSGCR